MIRKAQAQVRKSATVRTGLTPMLADQINNISDLRGHSLFNGPSIHKLGIKEPTRTWSQTHSSVELEVSSSSQPLSTKKTVSASIIGAIKLKENNDKAINPASEAAAQQPLEKSLSSQSSSSHEKRKRTSKTWALTSWITTRSITNQTTPMDNFETGDLCDSLHESLNGDQISTYQYMKSQGQYRLPSINSSSSKRASNSHIPESSMSHALFNGRNYRRASENSHKEQVSREGCSIVDSLEGDSLISKPKYTESKKTFRISNIGTIRSKYIASFNNESKTASNTDMRSSLKPRDINREFGRSLTERPRTADAYEGELLRSDLASEDADGTVSSGSLNDRSTIKTSSTKTLVTVYSQDASLQMSRILSRTTSQIKSSDRHEGEYCEDVKRLYLLGSGSEAKVILLIFTGRHS